MDWRVKASMQRAVASLPYGRRRVNWLLQRYVTRSGVATEASVVAKWEQTRRLLEVAGLTAGSVHSFRALEVGTGWHPVCPLALRAHGATAVTTVDLEPLLAEAEVRRTLEIAVRGLRSGQLRCEVDPWSLASEWEEQLDSSAADALVRCGITPLVSRIEDVVDSHPAVDLTITNNTLEHVPSSDLVGLLASLRSLASASGLTVHYIDLRDHYAGFDSRIGPYNFLRYTDREWRRYNNALHYQNRLRASDYLRCFIEAGFEIVALERAGEAPPALAAIELAREFWDYEVDDLLTHSLWVAARPA